MQPILLLHVLLTSHNSSVYLFINESKSWSEAQAYCRQYYTDLATVYDMTDVERLRAAAHGQTDAWIGLYKTSNELEDRVWHWSQPGVKFNENEKNWNSGEPNDYSGSENSVFIYENSEWADGKWSESTCFICYNESSTSYQFINQKMNWLEAQSYCRENYTDLISGRDQLDKIKKTHVLEQKPCDPSWNTWWIGLSRDTWAWSDGSNSSFRNWDKEEQVLYQPPKYLNSTPPVNQMNCSKLGVQGKWTSDRCNQTHPFICYDDHFILVKENKTWEEALVHCRQLYQELAWFTDEDQKRAVQERAKMANSEVVWVGLYYSCFLEAWFSVNGHFVSGGDWTDPGPNDCGVSGAMERGGDNLWVKRASEEKNNFICAHC